MRLSRRLIPALLSLLILPALARAQSIPFETETLPNGLQVIYAPMKTSPVVHTEVLYHVGAKDERPDRQGFAHMFEHMMFRGSAHVKPEEHMKLIQTIGGYSNAYTSFDQTVYINTVPATYVELPLWLEADRMASFRVSPKIFSTERLVVTEEWRLRQNQPYGTVWEEMLSEVFTKHHYHWTPIGNMDHLRAAAAQELQDFFNTYYVPNNAVLVIAGNIDVKAVRETVRKDFAWIPKGPAITRVSPPEPEQKEARRNEITMRVPLARLMIGYPAPKFIDDDQDALGVMLSILGEGRSCRLVQALVTSPTPLCTQADAFGINLEDGGVMGASAMMLDGKDPADVEKILRAQIAALRDQPVTAEELAKAKMAARLELVKRWETADKVAGEVGEEMLFRGNLSRIGTEQQRIDAITAADIQRVAKKYFSDERASTLLITPDPKASLTPPSTITPAAATQASTQPVAAKMVNFPTDYPTQAPFTGTVPTATFEKGVEKIIGGVKVIVMTDRRLPIVNFSLVTRRGSYDEPAEKTGLGGLTATMIRRGPAGTTYNAFNELLESRGVTLDVSGGGDFARLNGNCLTQDLPFALEQARKMLRDPALDPAEFAKLKSQMLSSIMVSLNTSTTVAEDELDHALFGDTPLGRTAMPQTLKAITLDDVKAFYKHTIDATDAIMILTGDISVEDGQKLATEFLANWPAAEAAKPAAVYPPIARSERHIVLIDRPESRQANIRMGIGAYNITSDDKFPGSLAGQILSAGIDSRLGRYVRAERGLTYGIYGMFSPTRQSGEFLVSTDTKVESTVDCIEATFKVLDDMKAAPVTEKELTDAKLRTAGSMLMQMQTTWQQAQRRVDGILNNYPLDYYDVYPQRIGKVTLDQIQQVMNKYVDNTKINIIVVGPADQLKEKLEALGKVEVLPMPLKR